MRRQSIHTQRGRQWGREAGGEKEGRVRRGEVRMAMEENVHSMTTNSKITVASLSLCFATIIEKHLTYDDDDADADSRLSRSEWKKL